MFSCVPPPLHRDPRSRMDDKTALLNQLRIDRVEPAARVSVAEALRAA
jgi:hypothetical protein